MVRSIITLITLVQTVLAFRVLSRMARTANGKRVERSLSHNDGQSVSVILPVLNEVHRLLPCLAALAAQGDEVREILVADGGSVDSTPDVVHQWEGRDSRVRLVDASPVPPDINGKAHGLQKGFEEIDPRSTWILTIDADVRPDPLLVRSLLAHASKEEVVALSAATQQSLSGTAEGLLHPAMLGTLVYRFGIPGHATNDIASVQANGQCFLVRRDVLESAGGFASITGSVCEDVTLARSIAARGSRVGFYETDGLVSVEMYSGWREAWDNWTRSLPMRDGFSRWSGAVRLTEVLAVQALPLWLAPVYRRHLGQNHPATLLNVALVCCRFGVLAGMGRAYTHRPWTYWLSPVCDLPVALRLWTMWRRRRHVWRGRAFVSGHAV